MLTSFPENTEAVVIGASGGIGARVATTLAADPAVARVHAFARRPLTPQPERVTTGIVDILDEMSLEAAAATVDAVRLVFVATGILHEGERGPEKSWRQLDLDWMDRVMRVNAFGPALAAKHFLPKLPREGKAVFATLSARVGSIADNRLGGWYGYRASKAALNMLLKSLSVELARTHKAASVIGLHPGTVDTGLSKPFQRGVPDGTLFTPAHAAERLLAVVDAASADQSGCLFAWDGQRIPF